MKKELIIAQKCQSWLKKLGKEKLQSFQDSFAEMYNLSLCLLTLDGTPLTVWSNSSLFCHYMMQNNRERCMQERENVIKYVIKKRGTYIFTCYLGLTFFCIPIISEEEVIAVCYGGAVYLNDNKKLATNGLINIDVPIINERKLKDMINLLENTFSLLSIKEETRSVSKLSILHIF